MDYWYGNVFENDPELHLRNRRAGSGWGMNYLVAVLYTIFGRNILAAQTFCAVFGAATAPLVYFCSKRSSRKKRLEICGDLRRGFSGIRHMVRSAFEGRADHFPFGTGDDDGAPTPGGI